MKEKKYLKLAKRYLKCNQPNVDWKNINLIENDFSTMIRVSGRGWKKHFIGTSMYEVVNYVKERTTLKSIYKIKWYEHVWHFITGVIIMSIITFFHDVRNRCQRFIKMYSTYDTSEIDGFFLETILPMIKEYRKSYRGLPSCFKTFEEWEKVLDEIIEGLELAKLKNYNYTIFDDEFDKLTDDMKEHYTNDESIIISKKKYDRAFKLFGKYFGCFND